MIYRPALAVAAAFGLVFAAGQALAAVKTKTIEYKDGGVTLKGVLAWDGASSCRVRLVLLYYWVCGRLLANPAARRMCVNNTIIRA
jgi:hypothetical protein